MPSPRDLRLLLLVKAVVSGRLKHVDDRHRAALLADDGEDPDDAMVPGERKAVFVRLPDGTRKLVGHVRADPAPVKVTVTSERELLAWVQENAPHELVKTVRKSYLTKLLEHVKDDPEGRVPHPETGELLVLPGVSREDGAPRVVVSAAKDAEEALAAAHLRGELPQFGRLLREIGPGEGEPPPVV